MEEIFCLYPSGLIGRLGAPEIIEPKIAKFAEKHTRLIYFFAPAGSVPSA